MRLGILISAMLICAGLSAQVAGNNKPNVIMMVIDDLNDWVGFLEGHPQTITPHMDKLALRGTVFTNAYCSVPQCSPSRASFLTGTDPSYSNVYLGNDYNKANFRANFDSTVYTLPEILKDSGGYYTIISNKVFHGKNMVPGLTDTDFDTSNVDPCEKGKSWNRSVNLRTGPAEPVPTLFNQQGVAFGFDWGFYSDSLEKKGIDYRGVDSSLNILRRYFANPSKFCDRPFFMAIGVNKPHTPYHVPNRFRMPDYNQDYYALPYDLPYNEPLNQWPPNGVIMPPQPPERNWADYDSLPMIGQIMSTEYNYNLHQQFLDWPTTLASMPVIDPLLDSAARYDALAESHRANGVLGYLSAIRYADDQVGRIMQALETRTEVFHNTIIILISDHGYSLGQKKHWKKVALWETDIRVPMVIVDPRRAGNKVCTRTVSLLDLFPTIMELTGTPEPTFADGSRYLQGHSLVPLIDNPDLTWNRPAQTGVTLPIGYPEAGCHNHFSIRNERFHYIRYRTNGPNDSVTVCDYQNSRFEEELYEIGLNREVDPHEWNNLAGNPAYRDIMDHLAQWTPEGPLFTQKTGSVSIVHEPLPCLLALSDTLNFSAEFKDEDGNFLNPDSTDLVVSWYADILVDSVSGTSFTWVDSLVDSMKYAASDFMWLTLSARDTAMGILYSDIVQVALNTQSAPYATFNLTLESNSLTIENYADSGNINRSYWSFGDGINSTEKVPGNHHYTMPDSFSVVHTIYYGNKENECEVTQNFLVAVDSSAFDSVCLSPQLVWQLDRSADRLQVEWQPVFGALEYKRRHRNEVKNGEWRLGSGVIAPFYEINALKSNTQYLFQVQSVCDSAATDSSEWSYPIRMQTLPCEPPRNIEISNVTTVSATVKWTKSMPLPVESQLIYKAVAGGAPVFNPAVAMDSIVLTGLIPSAAYLFKMRSACPQIGGTLDVNGTLSELFSFMTADTSGVKLNSFYRPEYLSISPNPSTGYTNLNINAANSGAGTVRIVSESGKLHIEEEVKIEAGNRSYGLDVSSLPAGSYIVSVSTSSEHFNSVLIVLDL